MVDFLKDAKKFQKLGGRIPKGILMVGAPGTGKTLLAKAIAGEADSSFFSISGSDFVEMFVGVGASRVRDMFEQARKSSPCLVFIDEIDAIIPSRTGAIDHHYAAEVNEILVQMNDASEDDVFVIGATNCPDKMDTAVLRTGRFDKIIYVPPPDMEAREEMFKMMLEKRPVNDDIDYGVLADKTESYVSSDVKFIADGASRAALKERGNISMCHLLDTIKRIPPSVSLRDIAAYERFSGGRS